VQRAAAARTSTGRGARRASARQSTPSGCPRHDLTKVVGAPNLKWRETTRYFLLSVLLIVVAEMFSLLDLTRTWCNPDNLILHGPAIGHVLGALSIWCAFLHYRQLDLTSQAGTGH
jgi:hypothetical protein